MVKKSSFLERLFGSRKPEARAGAPKSVDPRRDRVTQPPSARKTGAERPVGASEVRAALEAAQTRTVAETVAPEPAEKKDGNGSAAGAADLTEAKGSSLARVLGGSRREEAAQALVDGFKDLGGLLQGIHERLDAQGRRSGELNEKFSDLPVIAKAQIDFMSRVSQQLVEQREKTGELLAKLSGLPGLLDGIHKTLERQTAVEERTEKNLRDFRTTMDKIHSSIGQLTQESQKAVREATESFERSHSRTTKVFEETQRQAYETFEKTQTVQVAQLAKLMERSSRVSRSIVVLLVLVFASLVALFAIVLGQ